MVPDASFGRIASGSGGPKTLDARPPAAEDRLVRSAGVNHMAASRRAADEEPMGRPERRGVRLVSIAGGGRRRPNLFVNPTSDAQFAQQTTDFVTAGTTRPEDLADQLRPAYPNVVARMREISGESESWYVYRDGHWVDEGSVES
jgi:hypothetical protein